MLCLWSGQSAIIAVFRVSSLQFGAGLIFESCS